MNTVNKYRERCRPRTQEQAEAWAAELDDYCDGRRYGRIQTQPQAEVVAEELGKWVVRSLSRSN